MAESPVKTNYDLATVHTEEESKSKHELASTSLANDEEASMTFSYVWRNHKKVIWWSFYWAMCATGWGFDAQINGAMIAMPPFRRDFGYVLDGQAILPARWQSAFNVCGAVGQFFGGFLCSWLADRIGRKPSLLCGIVICTSGILGEIFSPSPGAFLASKIILGSGLGFYLTLGPMVCSEITPVVLRGLSTAGVNLGISVGQLISNAVIKGFSNYTDHWAYRGPFAIQLVFCLFLLAGFPFAPESPWYLVKQNKIDQARKSLQKLWGKDHDVAPRLNAIQCSIEESSQQAEARFSDCFRGTNLLRTGISCGGFVCQHVAGIIFVLGYSTYFFELAGLGNSHAFDLGVGVTACGVLGNFISWFMINTSLFGRRNLFIGGMAILTTLLLMIGIMDVVPTAAAKWVQASCTVIYAFFYFMTIGAVAFVLLGETSSPVLRAKTTALATAVQALFGLIMNFVIPYMVNPDEGNMKGKVGFVWGGLSLIATIGSWVYVPELKGRSFEEIDIMFARRVPPRKMGDYQFE